MKTKSRFKSDYMREEKITIPKDSIASAFTATDIYKLATCLSPCSIFLGKGF
jgi:hypothetical protein